METNNSQLVIYQTPQGDTRIDVRVKGDTQATAWCSTVSTMFSAKHWQIW